MVRGMERIRKLLLGVTAIVTMAPVYASPETPAYKVNGKIFTVSEAAKKDQSTFFELEKKKYDRIGEIARDEYLEQFWTELSQKKKTSVEKAKEVYLKEHVKVSDSEVKKFLEQFKDHPQLSKMTPEERKKEIRDYLNARETQKAVEEILEKGEKDGKFQVLISKPQEPVFEFKIRENEPVRYGPTVADNKPVDCKGDACPITIIEYSEYQCPYCSRMLADTTKVLEQYKGKIRWLVRDFPLESIHPRAVPAAVAAKCAHFQGKYWDMYASIFDDQKNLSDDDLTKRAEKLKLDMKKFNECFKMPKNPKADSDWKKANEMVRENIDSGMKYGVNGTPAFFINGRKLSGALPFSEFKRVIDEELAKKPAKTEEVKERKK